jgi:hypothetical protein
MAFSIPQKIFDKYNEIIDATINDLGVDCQLIYVEKVEELDNPDDNRPENRSINPHRRKKDQYNRDNKTYKEVEKTETIKMKVYWDRKAWLKVGGVLVVPDNSIQTVFFGSDLGKVMRAKQLIAHTEIDDDIEMKFKKFGEPFPIGFHKERYWVCFWERT